MATRKKPVARKTPPDTKTQKERFIEAAKQVGATDDPAEFDRAFKRVVKPAKVGR